MQSKQATLRFIGGMYREKGSGEERVGAVFICCKRFSATVYIKCLLKGATKEFKLKPHLLAVYLTSRTEN